MSLRTMLPAPGLILSPFAAHTQIPRVQKLTSADGLTWILRRSRFAVAMMFSLSLICLWMITSRHRPRLAVAQSAALRQVSFRPHPLLPLEAGRHQRRALAQL